MLRKEVIVDTNALLIPGEFGVDIFEELERLGYERVIVPKAVLKELDRLRHRADLKGKEKRAANIGYSLVLKYMWGCGAPLHRCKVIINEEEEGRGRNADEIIAELALKKKAAVLTNDEPLMRKLLKSGVVTVYLRGENRLEEYK
ncbi:MAG: PIN domain-containing protein [Methanophagales archaeon]|nr:PIN domain-containing protein [Methanophagales archaeon]MCW3140860.1 PIN domain-containing protein [Methanophagales archaeon]